MIATFKRLEATLDAQIQNQDLQNSLTQKFQEWREGVQSSGQQGYKTNVNNICIIGSSGDGTEGKYFYFTFLKEGEDKTKAYSYEFYRSTNTYTINRGAGWNVSITSIAQLMEIVKDPIK